MVAFFRSLYPTRLLVIVLLFLLLRLPLLLHGLPLTLAELEQMLLGERLNDGPRLYEEVFTAEAPLAAFVYELLDLLFGRSQRAYQLLAAGLLLLQALRLNAILNRNGVHPEKSYLPALLYALLANCFWEFDTLSPMLLGTTFLIFSLRYLTTFSKEGGNNKKLFKAGFMIGLAALCYLPLAWYLLLGLFAIFFFASNSFRSFLLMLCGLLFPYMAVVTYFLYSNRLTEFAQQHLARQGGFHLHLALPLPYVLLLVSPMLLVLGVGLLRQYTAAASLNYRVRFQQLMVLWVLLSVPVLLSGEPLSVRSMVVLLPPVAYFSWQAFTIRFPWWAPEVLLVVVAGGVLATRYSQFTAQPLVPQKVWQALVVPPNPHPELCGRKVLVLGPDLSPYQCSQPAGPYLGWELAQDDYSYLNSYAAIYRVHRQLQQSQPDFIVDQGRLMPHLQQRLPWLQAAYRPRSGKSQVYERVAPGR